MVKIARRGLRGAAMMVCAFEYLDLDSYSHRPIICRFLSYFVSSLDKAVYHVSFKEVSVSGYSITMNL
jgi:hypothetical protein